MWRVHTSWLGTRRGRVHARVRRAVPRAGGGDGAARFAAQRRVHATADLSGLLRTLPPRHRAHAVLRSARRGAPLQPVRRWGLPPQARAEERAMRSLARASRGFRDEFAAVPAALQQARALDSFGDKPLAVVTAGSGSQDGWLPLQDEMAALSTRGRTLVVPDATHASLIEDERDAAVSSQAILNVVDAVRGASGR